MKNIKTVNTGNYNSEFYGTLKFNAVRVEVIKKNVFRSQWRNYISKITKNFYSCIITNFFCMVNNKRKYPIFNFMEKF